MTSRPQPLVDLATLEVCVTQQLGKRKNLFLLTDQEKEGTDRPRV